MCSNKLIGVGGVQPIIHEILGMPTIVKTQDMDKGSQPAPITQPPGALSTLQHTAPLEGQSNGIPTQLPLTDPHTNGTAQQIVHGKGISATAAAHPNSTSSTH